VNFLIHRQISHYYINLLTALFHKEILSGKSNMKVFWTTCAEIIRSNGLKLTRCHGHYLAPEFPQDFLYCMEKAKGQIKNLHQSRTFHDVPR